MLYKAYDFINNFIKTNFKAVVSQDLMLDEVVEVTSVNKVEVKIKDKL